MKKFLFLLKREFRLFFDNKVLMAIFLGAPLLYGILLGGVYQKGKVTDLPILVIDLDHSPLSENLIQMMEDNEVVVPMIKNDEFDLNKEIIRKEYAAIIRIPENFEADVLQKRNPEVVVDVNTANILTANYAAKALQVIFGTLNAGVEITALNKQGVPIENAKSLYNPIKITYQKFYNSSGNYMNFLYPGVLGVIIQQVFMLALALSFSQEFESKTFETVLTKKVKNPFYLIFLKTLPFLIMGIGILFLLRLMFPLFHVPFHGDSWAMISILFWLILSVSALGIMVSIAIPSQLKATEILMVIATPSFILSGFTWPMSQMPVLIQSIANAIPLTHFLKALRKILLFNATTSDIVPELAILIGMTLLFWIVSVILLKFKIKKVP
ncbi:MAG: ABC transporter permease [Flavobacteriaceae bacterium]